MKTTVLQRPNGGGKLLIMNGFNYKLNKKPEGSNGLKMAYWKCIFPKVIKFLSTPSRRFRAANRKKIKKTNLIESDDQSIKNIISIR